MGAWGSHAWADLGWGAGVSYAIQGDDALGKQDTRYAATTQTTDRSQYVTDLTASGYAGYEAASARAAVTGEWCLEHRADYDYSANTNDVLLTHGNDAGTSYTYRMRCGASGIECAINGGTLVKTLAVATGVVDRTVTWSMRANPGGTGSSTMISEFCVYDHDAGDWEIDHEQVIHATPTSDTGWNLCVHGQWDDGGATLNNELATDILAVRVSNAFHSHTEVYEDWVAPRNLTAATVDEYSEPLPVLQASGMGDEGQIVGATQLGYLCEAQRMHTRRAYSPLVNEVYNERPTWLSTYVPANFMRQHPNDTGLRMPLTYLRWVPIPSNASHIWSRVQLKSYVTTSTAVPVKVACVTMNYAPGMKLGWQVQEGPPQQFESYWGHATVTRDDTGGVGEWTDLGKIKLAKSTRDKAGWAGTTFLCLAYEVDPESASSNDANARLEIGAWQVWALSETPGDGELNPDGIDQDLGE